MTTEQNMSLWNSVFVTDPRAVKPITGKSYSGNSPKPYWLIQKATERFGPIGIGWGVTVKSERFERMIADEVLHVAVVSVWYILDGKRSETFDQMGGTKAAYVTSKGKAMVDEDAGKKSVTDGMVKCLSMLGFAGDIFTGMWDDSKYVDWAAEETRRRETPRLSSEQAAEITTLLEESGADVDAFFAWISKASGLEVTDVESMPAESYPHAKKKLEAKKA